MKVFTHQMQKELTIIIILATIISSKTSLYQINSLINKNVQKQSLLTNTPILSDFTSSQYLSVSLSSYNSTKSIPVMRQSSCQLIIFVFHQGQFTIQIDNIQDDINLMIIQLKTLNQSFLVCPNNRTLTITVDTDVQGNQKLQITQYFNITGLKMDINQCHQHKKFNNQPKPYNNEYQRNNKYQRSNKYQHNNDYQGINKYQGNNKQQANDISYYKVYQQVRKVYLIRCSNQDWSYVTLPNTAIIITQVLAFILIIVLSHNLKYRRFTPLNFGFVFAILYSILIFLIIYIDDIIQTIMPSTTPISIEDFQIPKYLIAVGSLIAIIVYVQDICNIWLENKYIMLAISIIFSLTILLLDLIILQDYWYINNVIAILVSGCVIKFIVIRKLKTSVLPLAILWLFSILRQFVHVQSVVQEISLQIFPLHLQIPACFGDDPDGYSCSAFGSSKIIIIGLIINYAIRIDLFISSKVYQLVNLTVAFICLLIELGLNFLQDQIPVMEYLSVSIFLPFSLLTTFMLANKRGQWAIVWHGSFYDMAVNRTSIRKSQNDSLVSQNFGQTLLLNSSENSQSIIIEK